MDKFKKVFMYVKAAIDAVETFIAKVKELNDKDKNDSSNGSASD